MSGAVNRRIWSPGSEPRASRQVQKAAGPWRRPTAGHAASWQRAWPAPADWLADRRVGERR